MRSTSGSKSGAQSVEIWRAAAGVAALLLVSPLHAQEMLAPRVTVTKVDWQAAVAATGNESKPAAEVFAALNARFASRFSGIANSSVPVLLPVDVAGFSADAGTPDASASNKHFGDFSPSKFFLAGPAGYDATFWINPKAAGLAFDYPKPIEIEIGGAAFVYDLDDPNHQEVFAPPKALTEKFPGMRRVLRESHVRYAFERFGVPYVVSIQCYDRKPSARYLACREADQAAARFLNRLEVAGGAPSGIAQPKVDLSRPEKQSKDFTYYPPGDLIPNSGWHKMPGRADYHVYARLRFPIANPTAYVKSQSFMPWGDCYRTGHRGKLGRKGRQYSCKVNDRPLVFDESAAENFSYPWRDNFCETRDFLVGQCPGGYGHQGQDIRPANCVLADANADRCLPYQHTIAAAHDGMLWRTLGYLGLYIVWNTADEHVRVRYLHMNPKMMDADGLVSGRLVSEGEILGKVATWGDYERGTSYHLHFNVQVFTREGWIWVNPYETLVASYERLIGARGRELKAGEPAPPVPDKPPVILAPAPSEASQPAEGKHRTGLESAAKSKPAAKSHRKKKHRSRTRRRRHDQQDE
jgi:hypothetical protein